VLVPSAGGSDKKSTTVQEAIEALQDLAMTEAALPRTLIARNDGGAGR